MSWTPTDEQVEKTARALAYNMTNGLVTEVEDQDRDVARAVLVAVGPMIAEAAWDEGHNTPPETVPSRENEPPVGSWVRDRFGGTSFRQPDGWGEPGVMPFGRWVGMWDARGPYTLCGPWGAEYQSAENPYSEKEAGR